MSQHRQPGTIIRYASLSDPGRSALSRRDLVRLAASRGQCIVRVTGGAGEMDRMDGVGVGSFLATALGGSRANAAVIAGATITIDRPVPGLCDTCTYYQVHCREHNDECVVPRPGVMDVLMHLSLMRAPARTVGIAPIVGDPCLYSGQLIVENIPSASTYTVVDDRCPVCLLLQFSTDKPGLTWDDEWRVALGYMELLRNEAQRDDGKPYPSLHLVFNGGKTTRNECLHVAALPQGSNPWQMLLVEDSGRMASSLANDLAFRGEYPHVISCTKDELATVVQQLGFAPSGKVDGKDEV